MLAVGSLKEMWNEWELRALALLSLTLQIILIIMGNRRKYTKNNIWITIIVWFPYLIADAVAITALGVLTRNTSVDDGGLKAFWAPFLLLHLGGPDTITAYSLEDNNLWSRHLLQLVVQTGFAFYIFVMAWTGSLLSILSISMLFAGLLKYGERTWVLWSASYEQRRVSESIESLREPTIKHDSFRVDDQDEDSLLAVAYRFGKLTKWFFADVVVDQSPDFPTALLCTSYNIWLKMSPLNAFKTIEMELGFMYDALYTKAMVTCTPWGIVLRFVSSLLSSMVLILFSVSYHKQKYSKADLYITFLLLSVAVFLELYAALVVLSSNQSIAWLTTHKRRNISKAIISSLSLCRNPTWSNRMGQFSMLSYFLQEKSMGFRRLLLSYLPKRCHKIPNISKLEGNLEIQEYEAYERVPERLKEFIFRCFLEEIKINEFIEDRFFREPMRSSRGKISLERHGYDYNSGILAEIIKLDVENSIITWHIATEFSFYLDADDIDEIIIAGNTRTRQTVYDNIGWCYDLSMCISRYMMHLLAFSPYLFPKGGITSEIPLKDTYKTGRFMIGSCRVGQATRSIRETEAKTKIQSILSKYSTTYSTDSELFDYGCNLLHIFSIHSNEQEQVERRWKTICGVWMELLAHISTECTGNQHAQLLRQGGELLSHVSLLIAHVGLSKHFYHLLT